MASNKVLFSWSGGKDSALALHELRRGGGDEIVGLMCMLAETNRRVSHHGVREELLDAQAEALGLPVQKVYLPPQPSASCGAESYERLMHEVLLPYRRAGVCSVAHGDIFLQNLRDYRERNLARIGMRGLFPIWSRDSAELMETFIRLGFKAYVCCVDGRKLDRDFAGRLINADFVRDLPSGVDPCGEHGEYHSFVYDGPIFRWPVAVRLAETVQRDHHYYADLIATNGRRNMYPSQPQEHP